MRYMLKIATLTFQYCRKRISSTKLVEMRKLTDKMDQTLYEEIKLRGLAHKNVEK